VVPSLFRQLGKEFEGVDVTSGYGLLEQFLRCLSVSSL
jgi:hypothetical protein